MRLLILFVILVLVAAASLFVYLAFTKAESFEEVFVLAGASLVIILCAFRECIRLRYYDGNN